LILLPLECKARVLCDPKLVQGRVYGLGGNNLASSGDTGENTDFALELPACEGAAAADVPFLESGIIRPLTTAFCQTTNAGGLGVIGGLGYSPMMLREQVSICSMSCRVHVIMLTNYHARSKQPKRF
jgi:hypothetical protein